MSLSFHLTTKNVTLEGTILSADSQKVEGGWIRTSLELNDWVRMLMDISNGDGETLLRVLQIFI